MRAWGPGKESDLGVIGGGRDMQKKFFFFLRVEFGCVAG